MTLNLVAVILFVVNFVIRVGRDSDAASVGCFVLSLVAVGLLGMSGWLGGKLAYRYGVRVADERTQADGFR